MIDVDSEDAIKLIDFGLSHDISLSQPKSSHVLGTAGYMAPEVINGKYDQKCDMWSIGVIMFTMLCGRPPFGVGEDGDDKETLQQVLTGSFEMNEDEWEDVSDEAKELVTKMLAYFPDDRISANDAIKHPWIAENTNRVIGK